MQTHTHIPDEISRAALSGQSGAPSGFCARLPYVYYARTPRGGTGHRITQGPRARRDKGEAVRLVFRWHPRACWRARERLPKTTGRPQYPAAALVSSNTRHCKGLVSRSLGPRSIPSTARTRCGNARVIGSARSPPLFSLFQG